MKELTILGAGLAGLSCAYHFPQKSLIYEAKDHLGGTASSMQWEGFTYDYGPHVSFTKDEYIKQLFSKSTNGEFFIKNVLNANYYQGQWVRHPAISNLVDFSLKINRDALVSFLESRHLEEQKPSNYRDWCELGQGKFFAENFTHIYTRKFWTVEPEELTYQWAGERVARPSLKRVVDGALGLQQDSGYYYTEFRYPKVGGYSAYSNFWKDAQDRIDIQFDHQITQIDLKNRVLSFIDKPNAKFDDILISSLPLPEFVALVPDVPEDVRLAASQLRCTSIALINMAINEPARVPYHWFYIYDEKILTPRVTIYSNLSEFNAPEGCTSLQAEVPFSSSHPLPTENIVEQVVDELAACGIFDSAKVLNAWQVNLKYGYVIYDVNREEAINTVHKWMRTNGVEPVGRFGLWQYLWSDQAVKSGKTLIQSWV
jgi:protoporphyrinogen oxidase